MGKIEGVFENRRGVFVRTIICCSSCPAWENTISPAGSHRTLERAFVVYPKLPDGWEWHWKTFDSPTCPDCIKACVCPNCLGAHRSGA